MRLLVDGLNTLPQKLNTAEKGVMIEARDMEGEFQVAPRVNLAEARAWYLRPAETNENAEVVRPAEYAVQGFYRKIGDNGTVNEFMVTDAPSSIAARRGLTEQIGLITAAFYWPTAKKSARHSAASTDKARRCTKVANAPIA